MILTELHIELNRWGDNKGKHTGHATFSGEAGKVTLNLTPQHIDEIFRTCADSIVHTAKVAAQRLTTTVIEQQKAIESGFGDG